ncbi:hypothetical protein Tco_0630284, partial [Tanacetum coccineum]
GNYMPSGPDIEIDYSQFTYGLKQSQTNESETQTSDFDTCESDCSVETHETHESLPEPIVNEPNVVCQPKVWSDAPIIEEYESDSEDEHVSLPIEEQETPSFANQQVKTPRKTVKNQFTHSKNSKVDKKGLGYGCTTKACFVCGSLSHLIRDCDFHEKRMAKQAELNNRMRRNSSQREIRPIWNNLQRVNYKNQFVPIAVLTRTGKILVNTVRASDTNNVSTARHNFNRQAVQTNAAIKVNTVKPFVNRVRLKTDFHKTHLPFSRSFNNKTSLRTNFSKQKVNTAEVNAVSAVGGKRETAIKPSAGCNWRPQRHNWHNVSIYNGGSRIIDSGCSRHMTGNKAYLAEYQDFNGGPVAFGGSKGYITGKGTKEIIDAGDSDKEDESAQDCFTLRGQEKDAFKAAEDLFGRSLHKKMRICTPRSTASPHDGLSLSDLTNPEQDDSEIPPPEDINQNSTDGIFTNSSYDDDGAVVILTKWNYCVIISPIPTSRIISSHPSALILGDLTLAVQTRSKVNKSSGAHAFVSYVQNVGSTAPLKKLLANRNFESVSYHALGACFSP